MKRANTDPHRDPLTASQAARRRSALWGAMSATLFRILLAVALLWLRSGIRTDTFFSKLLFLILLLDLGTIIPIWICLKSRLNEIKGGEEDAAAQY